MGDAKEKKGKHGVPEGFVNMKEMCERFGRSRKTVHIMCETGVLPRPMKFGRQNLWDRQEVEKWLKHAKFCK